MRTPRPLPADGVFTLSAPLIPKSLRLRGDPERSEDQDFGDVPTGVDEDALDADEIDTDRVTSKDGVVPGSAN